MLFQTRDGDLEVHEFDKDALVYIPSGWGHRTVNVGKELLIFGAIWPTGIGHDYNAMLTNDFKVRVFAGKDGPRILDKNEQGEI